MGETLTYLLGGLGTVYFGKMILKNKEDAKKRVIGGAALGLAYAYKGPEIENKIKSSVQNLNEDTKTRIYSGAGLGLLGVLFGPKIKEVTSGIDDKIKSSIVNE